MTILDAGLIPPQPASDPINFFVWMSLHTKKKKKVLLDASNNLSQSYRAVLLLTTAKSSFHKCARLILNSSLTLMQPCKISAMVIKTFF